jgi:microcystin-dependent protein
MAIKFANNAETTLASSITNVSTTLTVATGKGDLFPQITGGDGHYFVLTMEDASGNREEIKVEHRAAASDVMGSGGYPLTRGHNSTSARAWNSGDIVSLRLTKGILEDQLAAQVNLDAHLADTTDAHDASAISVSATGNLASTDVQAALVELQGDINTINTDKAPLASPTFTGTPAAPTAAAGANSTQLATTAFVTGALGTTVPTGATVMWWSASAPSGWLLLEGGTIGNGSSGGTARANADTENLFGYLWDSLTNSEAAVSGGRGANASADFAANKTITLPNFKGRSPLGSGQGNTAEGGGAGTSRTRGAVGGAETHTLTEAQLAAHDHAAFANETESTGSNTLSGSETATYAGWNGVVNDSRYIMQGTNTAATIGLTSSAGSGSAHNNMHPWLALNFIIKL